METQRRTRLLLFLPSHASVTISKLRRDKPCGPMHALLRKSVGSREWCNNIAQVSCTGKCCLCIPECSGMAGDSLVATTNNCNKSSQYCTYGSLVLNIHGGKHFCVYKSLNNINNGKRIVFSSPWTEKLSMGWN